MAYTDARTIASQLKKGEIRNLYYIFGADVVRVERLTKQIIKAAVGDNEEFALTRMNGKKIDFNELYDTVQMMPMMSVYIANPRSVRLDRILLVNEIRA